MMPSTYTRIAVNPLTPLIGAEIDGVDLRRPVTPEQMRELRAAFLEWKVLFFRDQDITTEQHLAFARQFGELEIHPFAAQKEGFPEVLVITHDLKNRSRQNLWHHDVTWRVAPSLGSILRALEVPKIGGDTLFADMYAAYEGLSKEVKTRIAGLKAVHDSVRSRERLIRHGAAPAEVAEIQRKYPVVEHPVVRTHPETGRKCLFVNRGFTQHICGVSASESSELLEHLYAQAAIPEYQCRFRWRANSVAFWDNRASQHYAASDYWPAVRRMERVTVVGDRPV